MTTPAVPLDGLLLLDLLGEGATGQVWRGRSADGTRVAVKIARPEAARSPQVLRLLRAEVHAMARLDHPNVLWVYDQGTVPDDHPTLPRGSPYVVLEHCAGGTVLDHPPRSWPELGRMLAHLLSALAHAHARDIVHRDLKPANVLWSGPDDVRPGLKLADFGVAHAVGGRGGARVAGTPRYMPPEQLAGELHRQGAWTDLYALGILAGDLAVGLTLPEGWSGWLTRARAPDPEERFRTAAAAWRALVELDPSLPAPPTGWKGDRHEGPRLRLQGAGLGLVALREHEIVGRLAERRRCWEELERLVAGEGPRVTVLRAAPGLGKTRLLQWLVARAREDGRTSPVLVPCADPVHPVSTLLNSLFRLEDLPVAARTPALLARLRPHLSEASLVQLRDLLDNAPSRWASLPCVRDAIGVAATERPLILCFDDVEADRGPVDLAREVLVGRVGGLERCWLLLATADADAAELGDELTLHLGPLSELETDRLLVSLIGPGGAGAEGLAARSAGHPGSVIAAVRRWLDDGTLVPDGRQMRRVKPLIWPEAPRAAEQLAPVLADAPPLAIEALELAAAQGAMVDEGVWEASHDETADGTFDPNRVRWRVELVHRLLKRGLAVETGAGFAFVDPALVEELQARARAAGRAVGHHRRLARLHEERGERIAASTHAAHAGDDDRALELMMLTGDRYWEMTAPRLSAWVELLRELLERRGAPPDDARRGRWSWIASNASLRQGDLNVALGLAEEALRLALLHDDQVTATSARRRRLDLHAVLDRMGDVLEEAEAHARGDDAPELRAKTWARLGAHHKDAERSELACACFDEADRLLAGAPTTAGVLLARVEVADKRDDPNRLDERVQRCREALAVVEPSGDLDDQRYVLGRLVLALALRGDAPEARREGRRLQRLTSRLGSRRAAAVTSILLAGNELHFGAPKEAAEALDTAMRLISAIDDPSLREDVLILRLACAARLGDVAYVDQLLRQLRDLGVREAKDMNDRRYHDPRGWKLVLERLALLDQTGG